MIHVWMEEHAMPLTERVFAEMDATEANVKCAYRVRKISNPGVLWLIFLDFRIKFECGISTENVNITLIFQTNA